MIAKYKKKKIVTHQICVAQNHHHSKIIKLVEDKN